MTKFDIRRAYAVYQSVTLIATPWEHLTDRQQMAWRDAVECVLDEAEPEALECPICGQGLKCPSCNTPECADCGEDMECRSCAEDAEVPLAEEWMENAA